LVTNYILVHFLAMVAPFEQASIIGPIAITSSEEARPRELGREMLVVVKDMRE
jgi:hypothetical protein